MKSFGAVAGVVVEGCLESGPTETIRLEGSSYSGEPAEVELVFPRLGAPELALVTRALLAAGEALAGYSAREIADVLGGVGARFLDAHDEVRSEALGLLPATAGISPEMAASVLDGMARDWTRERLRRLLETEFEVRHGMHPLDGFVSVRGRRAMAVGPRLCVQVVSGSVPGVGVHALVRSLLVKAPTLLKPGLGDVLLPVLFARALREADPALADALAVAYWPGSAHAPAQAAIDAAELVVVYGSDETVRALRDATRAASRFIAYHHRTSVGLVGRSALDAVSADAAAAGVARAVAIFDQRGCVSPQIVWVEEGGEVTPEGFCERLARTLAALEARLPSGALSVEEAAALQQIRGTSELLGEVWHGGAEAPWTVIFDRDVGRSPECVGRVVRVRPIGDALELSSHLEPLADHLQTLGVTGVGERLDAIAQAVGRVGVSRVASFTDVSFPPPWWHHDGRGPLGELVRWVEVETSGSGSD